VKTISRPNLPVYDYQPGEDPALVLLHYWGGSARSWQRVIGLLPGRAIVSIDARGWRRSRGLPGPYTLEQLAQDARDVILDAGLTDYILVGHSAGGKVAQLVAAAHPAGLAELILVGPAPAKPAATITPAFQEQLLHAYESDEAVLASIANVLTATPLSDDVKAQIVADSLDVVPEAREEWARRGVIQDITSQARAIEVPVTVIVGENDKLEPEPVLRDNLLPYLVKAELRVIPRTGHLMPLEAPADLARILRTAPSSQEALEMNR
jgi:pimeloyl-ACP methyl ester carboxylesterase